ncbi:tRNA (guanosine(18)-2'-O)-methyltransferase TrmH [Inmirania thermothiophila]|uniref:tRNA (guanosine(18)-2'-O)-methyltransferase n=1 Tax=Inmirania thermothiophila TaxID=1750597 RepID=A0A3N1Y0E1_9GAMM|nr:tRNA (guanosine(18)-2'-O)-methyltransferase TrmH [Inmirania thermothiophila]ROR32315.1 tRNA (guanosine-2'-O-)-methyltransferase [Inmirania thermothiophila]
MPTERRLARIREVLARRQPDLTVVMDNVHKPHNLAAIARTCDAVGVLEVHAICREGPVSLSRKVAMGTHKWVPVRSHRSVAEAYAALRGAGFAILAADLSADARDYREVDYTRPTAIVVGAELDGISEEASRGADGRIVIPLHGMAASLNVSVATAVILYEALRQREAAGLYDAPRLDPALHQRLLVEWAYPQVAAWCRRTGRPYPALDEAGRLPDGFLSAMEAPEEG